MTEQPWRVRPARPDDAEALGALHVLIWQRAYAGLVDADYLAGLSVPQRVERWRRIIAQMPSTQTTLLGVDAATDAPVAFATADLARDADPPRPWELWSLHVHPDFWGSGLGQTLLDSCLGQRPSYLWTLEGNDRAIVFYRRNGFVLDGARQQDNRLPVTDLRMVRPG